MPPKMRPQNVSALTGERATRKTELTAVILLAKRRCKAVSRLEPDASGTHMTRSKGPKKVFKLTVPDCRDCNLRNIEAFEEEFTRLTKMSLLLCHHKCVIQQVEPTVIGQELQFPPVTIPALTEETRSSRGAGAIGPGSTTSSMSSISLDKLEKIKQDLEQAYQELLQVHKELAGAVAQADDGQLTGYEDTYSDDALNDFLGTYTDMYDDAITLLEEKCDFLKNLWRMDDVREADLVPDAENVHGSGGSVFQDDASSDTRERLDTFGNESFVEEYEHQQIIGGQHREVRPSTIAQAGSPERLQRERAEIMRLNLAAQEASSVVVSDSTPASTSTGSDSVRTCTGTIPRTSVVISSRKGVAMTASQTTIPEFVPRSTQSGRFTAPSYSGVIQTTAGELADLNLLGSNTQSTLIPSDLSSLNTVLQRPITTPGLIQVGTGSAQLGGVTLQQVSSSSSQNNLNVVHVMDKKKAIMLTFLSSLDSDLSRISTGNAYKRVSRLRAGLQEGRAKITQYEATFRSYLPTIGIREQQEALMALSADVDIFDGELMRIERSLNQVEDRLEPQFSAHMQTAPQVHTQEPAPRSARTFLERTKLPVFSGKVEEFPDFAKQFKELTQNEGYPDAILLSKLRDSVPKEGKELLVGIEGMRVAWERLEKRYGNRKIAILTIQSRLARVVLTGEKHERVERLCGEVDRAVNLLRPLGALDALTRDFELVGRLVGKLPEALQAEWDKHATTPEFEQGSQTDWEKFVIWLNRQRKIADNAKIRWLEKQQSQPSDANTSKLPFRGVEGCWKCGRKGHQSRFCTAPTTAEVKLHYVEEAKEVTSANSKFSRPKTKAEWMEILPRARTQGGACPCCNKEHTYKRKFQWGELDWPSTLLKICPKFTSLSPVQRGKKVEEVKGCSRCTSWKHQKGLKPCPRGTDSCTAVESGVKCDRDHDTSLHGSGSKYCSTSGMMSTAVRKKGNNKKCMEEDAFGPVLLEIQQVPLVVNGVVRDTVMFFDNGSTATICTHQWAKKAGLTGVKVVYFLRVVGDQYTEKHTMLYTFTIKDNSGSCHEIKAYGMDIITEVEKVPDLSNIKHLFPGVPEEALCVPTGEVDILVGQNYRSIQPKGAEEVDDLRLVDSRFGCGKILTGTHPKLGSGGHCMNHATRMMKEMSPCLPSHASVFHNQMKMPSFFEAEELGTTPRPHCQSCTRKVSQCKDCSYRGQMLSRQQREVVSRVESSMHLDPDKQRIHVSYPLKPAAYEQRDNYSQAVVVQKNIERRLHRDQLMDDYNKEMNKAIQANSVVKLKEEEMRVWSGPVHYLTHFPVLKPESVTTKVRIVANSKMKNMHTGLSLNDVVEAGPNALAPLLEVLILWRGVEVALMFDLSKAYQQLVTGDLERHLRRFVYRGSIADPWEIYAYDRVTFGDVIAALCLELGKKLAAERGETIDPLASSRLINGTYVDDHCGGGSAEEVSKMKGDQDPEGGFTGTMQKILEPCGFRTNFMVKSEECSPEEAKALGGSVLGLDYDPVKDQLSFQIVPTMVIQGKKRKRVTTTLTPADVKLLKRGEYKLTRRMVLSLVMAQFDPLGLISPLLVHAKILLRRLYGQADLDWDDPLPTAEQAAWANFIEEIIDMKPIPFKRSTKPKGAKGRPWIVGFHDGSLSAYAIAIYVVWVVECDIGGLSCGPLGGSSGGPSSHALSGGPNVKPSGGPIGGQAGGPYGGSSGGPFGGPTGQQEPQPKQLARVSTLLLSKSRVSPIHGTTVPRAELQSLTVLSRMAVTAAKALTDKPEKAILVGDSECSIAALEKTGGVLGPYFGNRVAEIHENMDQLKEIVDDVEPVWHIPGPMNPADLATRGHALPADVGPGSVWQEGPDFLREMDRSKWPLSRSFRGDCVPTNELRSKHEVQNLSIAALNSNPGNGWCDMLDLVKKVMERTNSWVKSQGVLARVLRAKGCNGDKDSKRQKILTDPGPEDLEVARTLQFHASMKETMEALTNGKLRSLQPEKRSGIVVTTGRFSDKHLTRLLGKESLPIIMPNARLARLIFQHCHEEDHRLSATDTLARSRKFVWVPRGLKLAKSVIRDCMRCRLVAKSTAKQIMSRVPEGVLEVSPPFTASALDLLGPYCVRGMGGGARKPMKAWGMLVVCLRTKAITIFACAGYDTRSFMTAYSKFTSIYGEPALVISDQGTQITSAAKQLGQKGIQWERVEAFTARSGTKWTFTPRGCPWRNGMAERAVGMAKSTLAHQLEGNKSLDFAQMEALFLRVAYILNSRPIGVRMLSEDHYHPITPNDLLLGRAAKPRDSKEAEEPIRAVDPRQALSSEEELCERWWAKWIETAFPLLVPRGKWSTQHRNLCVGDIVLLKYEGKFSKDRYRLAKVLKVHPDKSGVVRTVTVGLRPRHVKEPLLPYKSKSLTEFAVGVQRLVVLLPKEEQDVQKALPTEPDNIVEEETPELVEQHSSDTASKPKKSQPVRRSKRLQKQDPEVFLTASAQGRAPRPTLKASEDVETSMICLFHGSPPLRVPTWMLEVIEEEDGVKNENI